MQFLGASVDHKDMSKKNNEKIGILRVPKIHTKDIRMYRSRVSISRSINQTNGHQRENVNQSINQSSINQSINAALSDQRTDRKMHEEGDT